MKNELKEKSEFYFGNMAVFIPILFLIVSILLWLLRKGHH